MAANEKLFAEKLASLKKGKQKAKSNNLLTQHRCHDRAVCVYVYVCVLVCLCVCESASVSVSVSVSVYEFRSSYSSVVAHVTP